MFLVYLKGIQLDGDVLIIDGAIYVEDGTINMGDCEFEDNEPDDIFRQ